MNRERDDHFDVDVQLGRAWREHRRHLLDVAFRMLGSLSEAEDAVQEAFARLVVTGLDDIDDVGGWLVVVVSRICLDRLRSQRRHPTVSDTTSSEHTSTRLTDPADRVTLDDTVRVALHVMLERLTPPERTAFVLHDVFQYPFEAISEIVGRSPAACRQLASRARRTIAADAGRTRFQVETAEQRIVTEQFMAACATGDLDGLLAVLDPDVDGDADFGGGRMRVAFGRDTVGPQLLSYLGPEAGVTLVSLHAGAESQILALRDGRIVAFLTLEIRDGKLCHIHALIDPVKLAPIAETLDG